ncbi:MAG: trypsin-like peptidase domain-containing protein [Gemmatimonadaceae bacterium]
MNKLARVQLVGAALIAFASGLVFASGFDLTKISWAQSGSQPAPKPTSAEVRPLEETGQAFEAIAEHVTPAVVAIEAEQLEPRPSATRRDVRPDVEEFLRQFQPDQQPRSGSGSGFIVTKDGYILTNNHVIANADRVTVTLLDNRRFPARIVGRDPTTDVAVLKVEAQNLPTVTLGDDNSARIGQWVVAIGNPLGLEFTVTAGIVSAKGRTLPLPNRQDYSIQDFIQTDAAINPGNSGGPLVNIRGEVIGINSAIASPTGFNAGYGFAIPITLAKIVMDDLVQFGRVRRAVLGVSIGEVEAPDARAAGLTDIRGVKVQGFVPSADESPARRAGVEAGDIIISAAGQRVNRGSELQRIIRAFKPGEVVEVDVSRFGERKTFRIRLGEPPVDESVVAAISRPTTEPAVSRRSYERLGVTVQALPVELARSRQVDESYRQGLLVSAVSNRGPAFNQLYANRDIIVRSLHPSRRDIRTAADLEELVRSVKRGDVLSLLVYDMGQRSTKVVNLPID